MIDESSSVKGFNSFFYLQMRNLYVYNYCYRAMNLLVAAVYM